MKFVLSFICLAVSLCVLAGAAHDKSVPVYTFRVVHVFPHDAQAFTQGLEYHDGSLFEGTGLNGRSTLRREDLESGHVLQEISLSDRYFGEGITVLRQRIFQITWQSHAGFVYSRSTFRLLKNFSYPGEGWGLANDGHVLYMSDGTDQIRILDPVSLAEQRRITVHDGGHEYNELNELECVRGEIYANVWQTDQILRISPRDGTVTGIVDLHGLLTQQERESGADVLNGIAYDAAKDRLLVTGKLWPKIFEIKLVPQQSSTTH